MTSIAKNHEAQTNFLILIEIDSVFSWKKFLVGYRILTYILSFTLLSH